MIRDVEEMISFHLRPEPALRAFLMESFEPIPPCQAWSSSASRTKIYADAKRELRKSDVRTGSHVVDVSRKTTTHLESAQTHRPVALSRAEARASEMDIKH